MPYKDPEKARACARRNAKRYAAKHPDKIKARRARWGAANRDYERQQAKERRARLKAAGLCIWCAVNKTDGGIHCDGCKEKQKRDYLRLFVRDPRWLTKRSKRMLYGITVEEFDAMRAAQEFKCAICGKHESKCKKGLHLDHNHETKQTRGLLCFPCNASMPIVEYERILPRPVTEEWKRKAREYLKQYENNQHQRGISGC